MFKHKKINGVQTPIYQRSIPPMPPITPPKSKVIKTVTKHHMQSREFDEEVNSLIESGWELDDVKVVSNNSVIILFAILHRFQPMSDEMVSKKIGEPKMVNCEQCVHNEVCKNYEQNSIITCEYYKDKSQTFEFPLHDVIITPNIS